MGNDDAPAAQAAEPPSGIALGFPVVGIGASAGGLRALGTLLEQVPVDGGMAYIVVLHLSPKVESSADKVLQLATRMPVVQVVEPMPVRPDHVYVIAPNTDLRLQDGQLLPLPAQRPFGAAVAIDLFFRSLAEAQRELSIGIVLSGTGSDGTAGLAWIREHGGVTIAQSPDEAEYDDMPRHAVAAGVDFVLAAADVADTLVELRRTAQCIELPPSTDPDAPVQSHHATASRAAEDALADILKHLAESTQHDFQHYKRATVLRRIERRMQINGQRDLPSYRRFLAEHRGEAAALLEDMLISVTSFFRDPQAFATLEREVIPQLFRDRGADAPVRAWVAGCATGEEAYSVAMLLQEHRDRDRGAPPFQVFASDIDQRALRVARTGEYPGSILVDVPYARLQHFFEEHAGRKRVRKSLRETVLFAVHNVLRDPPFSNLDLVCCRNMLIYLKRDIQGPVLETFRFSLGTGGYLFLGSSESAELLTEHFEPVDKRHRIYRARTRAHRPARLANLPLRPTVHEDQSPLRLARDGTTRVSYADVHQRILSNYAPPSVLIDAGGNVVHVSERAGRFLQWKPGEPTRSLVDAVLPELRLELRTALFQANASGKSVEARKVWLNLEGDSCYVNMVARPFHDKRTDTAYVLVLFDEIQDTLGAAPDQHDGSERGSVELKLEEELRHTRERLQDTMIQAEASAEDLKASNEELQAINEELRSTTEELETSKEELQSVNEELITVNSELKSKVDQLSNANDDLQNFIASTEIATVFVDPSLHIKRYTPRAAAIFNTIPSDVGRCLLDITHRLDYPELADDAAAAFQTLQPSEREVRSIDGRWYVARLLPYRTAESRIEGAVLTFVDITRLRTAEGRPDAIAEADAAPASTPPVHLRPPGAAPAAIRDEFLAVMSHELKQPLNLIGVNAQVLERLPELHTSLVARRALDNIHRSVRGQSKIIEDLLDLSRMRTGKLELALAPVDLVALARGIVEIARADPAAAYLKLACECGSAPILVYADAVRVEQALWNLLGNAIKFTSSGGHVTVRVQADGNDARLDVIDTGQGIAADFLPHIFEMFDQGDGRPQRNRGGLGVGLSLVRQLAELHGGHVRADSAGPGKGSTLSMWLPRYREEKFDTPVVRGSSREVLDQLRILLVDDSIDTVQSMALLLELDGAVVHRADSGREALEILDAHAGEIDLLLSDIGMPEMDGYQLVAAVRADPRHEKLPAIALTGFGRTEGGGGLGPAVGFSAQLTKPVSMDELVDLIAGLVAK